jgi:hypothetical protein
VTEERALFAQARQRRQERRVGAVAGIEPRRLDRHEESLAGIAGENGCRLRAETVRLGPAQRLAFEPCFDLELAEGLDPGVAFALRAAQKDDGTMETPRPRARRTKTAASAAAVARLRATHLRSSATAPLRWARTTRFSMYARSSPASSSMPA